MAVFYFRLIGRQPVSEAQRSGAELRHGVASRRRQPVSETQRSEAELRHGVADESLLSRGYLSFCIYVSTATHEDAAKRNPNGHGEATARQ